MDPSSKPDKTPPTLNGGKVVKFDYLKSSQFRTVRSDGVWGGVNGHLDIVMSFYSERPPIPQQVTHLIEGERLGRELEQNRISRDSIIREVEICVSMNVEVAKALRLWLDERIMVIEGIKQKAAPAEEK